MDPAANVSVLVRRWTPDGFQRLEVPNGKGWRLPYTSEIGLRTVEGVDGPEAFAPDDYDPQRMHRWVRQP